MSYRPRHFTAPPPPAEYIATNIARFRAALSEIPEAERAAVINALDAADLAVETYATSGDEVDGFRAKDMNSVVGDLFLAAKIAARRAAAPKTSELGARPVRHSRRAEGSTSAALYDPYEIARDREIGGS